MISETAVENSAGRPSFRASFLTILMVVLLSQIAGAESPFFIVSLPRGPVPFGDALKMEVILHYPEPGQISVPTFAVPSGLSVRSLSIEAFSEPIFDPGPKRTKIILAFSAEDPGDFELARIEILGPDFSIPIGPIRLSFTAPEKEPRKSVEWVRSGTPFLYESLPLSLASGEGELEILGLPAPTGAILDLVPKLEGDAFPGLRFLLTPWSSGRILIERISVDSDEGTRVAPAFALVPKPLPAELASSRAIGVFALSARRDGGTNAGEASLSVRITISGKGNFPCILPPEPAIQREGKPDLEAKSSTRRSDSYRPDSEGYSGEVAFFYDFAASSPGSYGISFKPYRSMEPESGRIAAHSIPRFSFRVAGPPGGGGSKDGGAEYAIEKAIAVRNSPLLEEALSFYKEGRKIESLARLKKEGRLKFSGAEIHEAKRSIESELGILEEPRFGLVPPPRFFVLPLSALLVASIFLGALSAKMKTALLRIFFTLCSVAFVLAFAVFCFSAWDSGRTRALLLCSTISPIPGGKAENLIAARPGNEVRIRAISGDYALVNLADGKEGWARLEDLAFY